MRIHGTVNFCLTSKTIRSKWSMGFLRFSRLKLIMRLKNRSRGMTTPNWTNMWLICNWCALWLPTVIFFFIKTYNLFIKPNTLIILKLQILNFYLRKLVFFFFKKQQIIFRYHMNGDNGISFVYFDSQMKFHQIISKENFVKNRIRRFRIGCLIWWTN